MEMILSTERWGESVDQTGVFDLLDRFVEVGGSYVETSIITPSTGQPEDFAGATRLLKKWLRRRRDARLKVYCTIGFLDNRASPLRKISASAILTETELVRGRTFDQLCGIRVDCGDEASDEELAECLKAMRYLRTTGLQVGLNRPPNQNFVAKINQEVDLPWTVGLSFNENTQKNIARLRHLLPQSQVILELENSTDSVFADLSPEVQNSVFGIKTSAVTMSELNSFIANVPVFGAVGSKIDPSEALQVSNQAS